MRLINDDCFNINPECDYIFTSPPYNRKRNDKYENYDDTLNDYYGFLDMYVKEKLPTCKYMFLNIQKNLYNKKDVFKLIGKYSDKIIDIIIWNKSNPMPASGFNITNAYEFIIVLSEKEKSLKSNSTYTKNIVTTSVHSSNEYKKIHRAVMKPDLARYILTNFVKRGSVIKDCFMGVGTTGIICKELDLDFIGIELNEEYFNIAKERIENVAVRGEESQNSI